MNIAMPYDFDHLIDRTGTHSVKYDLRKAIFGREDVIPMWVADMDFPVPPFILEAVKQRAAHPVYGYSFIPDTFFSALIGWQKRRHDWELQKEWIFYSPGVVTGLNMIIQAFTQPGDAIIVQPPVYFPFFYTVERNGRKLIHNRLLEKRGRYFIDFPDLEEKMKAGARMLILCNPHNPVGRSWSREELEWIGAKSLEYGVLVVSDEIHCDLVLEPNRHTPFATLSEEIAHNTVTCIAPSKTFNLAGLFTSSIIIMDEGLRKTFKTHEDRLHLSPNIFGITAAEAAYREGDEWLAELKTYLEANYKAVAGYISSQMPELVVSPMEATYLVWLNFRKWKLPPDELKKRLIHEAGLGFVDGREFGPGGEGFQRMNIGCALSTIELALDRLFSMRKSLTTL